VRLLVVGATGGLGRDVVAEAGGDQHQVAALVRNPARATLPAAVELTGGDLLRPASLTAALGGRDAVICVLGTPSPRQPSTLLREGTANLVAAMREAQVARLVCVTLLGLGQSRQNTSLVYRSVVLRVLAPMIPDKEAQEQAVRASEVDWLLIRPPRFTTGEPTGRLRVIAEGEPGRLGRVVRADLARFLVDQAGRPHPRHQALAVGS